MLLMVQCVYAIWDEQLNMLFLVYRLLKYLNIIANMDKYGLVFLWHMPYFTMHNICCQIKS